MLQLLGTAGTVKLYTALGKTLLILSYDPYSILRVTSLTKWEIYELPTSYS